MNRKMNVDKLKELFPHKKSGPWIAWALEHNLTKMSDNDIFDLIETEFPSPQTIPLQSKGTVPYNIFMDMNSDNEFVKENNQKVLDTLQAISQTPFIERVGAYPDACPTGLYSAPVGSVMSSTRIHPGFHSADVCCSMFATNLGPEIDPASLFETMRDVLHFGGGPRKGNSPTGKSLNSLSVPKELSLEFKSNKFLHSSWKSRNIDTFLGTIGDGNHFANICIDDETGDIWIVTHHGSRKPGATLYREGVKAAEKHCREVCPDLFDSGLGGKEWAWISEHDHEEYWSALGTIEKWTILNHKSNHTLLLDAVGWTTDQIEKVFASSLFTPHNFVFREDRANSDPLYHHAKGATPVSPILNNQDIKVIPLTMGSPILLVENDENNLSLFAPHGTGRLVSRSQHLRNLNLENIKNPDTMKKWIADGRLANVIDEQMKDYHVNFCFWTGVPDLTELPAAYKDHETVKKEIVFYGLAKITKELRIYGSVMAGTFINERKKNDRGEFL